MGILRWLGLDAGCEREPAELNDGNFEREVLRSDVPVVVDVWSSGCGPCTALVPTVKRLACKYDGRVKVAHLDAAVGSRTLAGLGVMGTPTMLFFRNGRLVESVSGLRGQHYYESVIDEDLLDLAPLEASG